MTILDRRAAAGEKIESLEYSETIDEPRGRYFRYMKALPVQPLCLSCHGTYRGRHVSTIAEEKSTNPRLAGQTWDQFIEIMTNLNLPMPGKIGEAVSANMRGGKADG